MKKNIVSLYTRRVYIITRGTSLKANKIKQKIYIYIL